MNGTLSSKSSNGQVSTNDVEQNGTTSTGQNGYEASCPKLKRVRLPFFSRARRNVKSVAVSAFWLPEFDNAQRVCEQRLYGAVRKRKASQCFADTCKEYDKWVFHRNVRLTSEEDDVTSHTGAKVQRLDETIGQNQNISTYGSTSTLSMTTSPPVSTSTKVNDFDKTINQSQASTSSQNKTVSVVPLSTSTNSIGFSAASPFVFGTAPSFSPSSSVVQHNEPLKPFQFGVTSPSISSLPPSTFSSQSLSTPFSQASTDQSTILGVNTSFTSDISRSSTDGNQIFAFNPASFSTTAKRSVFSRRRRR